MAITALANVFVPQVVGDTATDILFKKVPLLQSGYVVNAQPISINGAGNTITFPYWDTNVSGLVQNQTNSRTGVTPGGFTMSTYTETIQNKIISLDFEKNVLTDIAPSADLNGVVANKVAKLSAADIQSLLITKAETTNLSLDITAASTKTVTVDSIVRAKMLRGEYAEGTPALFLHSKQFADLATTSDYKSLASAANPAIVSAMGLPPGTVAVVHGVAIVLMDSVSIDTTPNPDTYTALMLWPGALQLYIKQTVEASQKTHAGSNTITMDFDFRYGATLFRDSPRGAIKFITHAT